MNYRAICLVEDVNEDHTITTTSVVEFEENCLVAAAVKAEALFKELFADDGRLVTVEELEDES